MTARDRQTPTGKGSLIEQASITPKTLRWSGAVGCVTPNGQASSGRCRGGLVPEAILQLGQPRFSTFEMPVTLDASALARFRGRWTFTATVAKKPAVLPASTVTTAIARCDNKISNRKAGCVFPSFIPPHIVYAMDDYGRHVQDAIASGLPSLLHRADVATTDANRRRACARLTRPSVEVSCDEYPFASSREGASAGGRPRTFDYCQMPHPTSVYGRRGWSTCFIPVNANAGGGKELARFYSTQRVLVGDAYYVGFPIIAN